jgi:hypothetical protein
MGARNCEPLWLDNNAVYCRLELQGAHKGDQVGFFLGIELGF